MIERDGYSHIVEFRKTAYQRVTKMFNTASISASLLSSIYVSPSPYVTLSPTPNIDFKLSAKEYAKAVARVKFPEVTSLILYEFHTPSSRRIRAILTRKIDGNVHLELPRYSNPSIDQRGKVLNTDRIPVSALFQIGNGSLRKKIIIGDGPLEAVKSEKRTIFPSEINHRDIEGNLNIFSGFKIQMELALQSRINNDN